MSANIEIDMESERQAEVAKRRTTFIAALREMADFFESHPDIRFPVYNCLNVFLNSREEVSDQARLASWQKDYNDTWFALRKDFCEDLRLEMNCSRETVCRKIVTGTRIVPAQPEHEVEEIEWICDEPLLVTK